ncbi:hypothetical protein [Actinokineospora enzanensis]|uniref:hypothetical protein n=1 Tax=Actinokineospora enzanensis TaxID=155975 RepID=UPI00039F482F|nr:hypothetical protein [Actinokineospora enzanensis]
MYIDEGSVGGAIGTGVADLLSTARAGGFAVNESGGQAMLKAIRNFLDWIDSEQDAFSVLSREPKLGSTNNAKVMKPFMVAVATDDRGFVTQVLALRDSLTQAEEAIKTAMANYRETDARAASTLGE